MKNKMTHTVIGLFDSRDEAKAASKKLVENGFELETMNVSNKRTGDTTATMKKPRKDDDESITDSIGNFFGSMFGDDSDDTRTYNYAAEETEAILTIQTDSKKKAEKAVEILDDSGAVDVDERAARNREKYANQGKTGKKGDVTIPVIEEDLQVGKRTVDTGGVRVRSRIVEKPVEETVRLREEHIVVNRTPVDRAVTGKDKDNFKEGEFEITERAEKAVVGKKARVVEEVSVDKNVTEDTKTVSDTVRRTKVDVDELDENVKAKKARK